MTTPIAKKIKRAKAERKQNRIPITAGMQFKSAGALMETVSKVPDRDDWYCKNVKEDVGEWVYSEDDVARGRVK